MRRLIALSIILVIFLFAWSGLSKNTKPVNSLFTKPSSSSVFNDSTNKVKVVTEESVTVDIVKKVGPSVVTISENAAPQQSQSQSPFQLGPFSIFGLPGQSQNPDGSSPVPDQSQPQSIGSGFIVSGDGLIVTNKHVVSDTSGTYQVITSDDKKYTVQKVYRDPLNDIAIVKINPGDNINETLKPVTLGDSSKLQVGQYACAIGTALGEFRNTVTTGIISGLGRGIQAGSPLEGYAEDLNNVIQTSTAINPGNSGGPLLNSSGQVIGVNTAVAQSGQNIGFALPINVIKDSMNNFNQTGQFNRPYLGVAYKMISRDVALMNGVPQGAYVQQVVSGSPAENAGIKQGDVITQMDNDKLQGNNAELSTIIAKKKVGDTVAITYYRDKKSQNTKAILGTAPGQ